MLQFIDYNNEHLLENTKTGYYILYEIIAYEKNENNNTYKFEVW